LGEIREVRLPDIGDFEAVEVIEVLVAPGDRVEAEDSLITLESDKATLEIPAPFAGVIQELLVDVGDQVSEGDPIAKLEVAPGAAEAAPAPAAEAAVPREPARANPPPAASRSAQEAKSQPARPAPPQPDAVPDPIPAPEARARDSEPEPLPGGHASPGVRRLARELGVDLRLVPGSGRKARVRKEDVQAYVKSTLSQGGSGVPIAGVNVIAPREIDFGKFGVTEVQPLNRVRKLSAANLLRSWVTIPHVTQFAEADVTELEAFRQANRGEAEQRGLKLTFLPFIVKAVVRCLQDHPQFNASLDRTGENLILKRYYHIGVAVDTEQGLVVPVVKDADQKGLFEIAEELQDLSSRARDRKLRPTDMQGGSFSISSLGGIGGSFFTPIVNHPEVAILGVSRMEWKPIHDGEDFRPRRVLPLSLSYDHRVVDGADAARFVTELGNLLTDLRRILL